MGAVGLDNDCRGVWRNLQDSGRYVGNEVVNRRLEGILALHRSSPKKPCPDYQRKDKSALAFIRAKYFDKPDRVDRLLTLKVETSELPKPIKGSEKPLDAPPRRQGKRKIGTNITNLMKQLGIER